MRRWSVLLAGAALWLFLAAIPALADGGPHVAAINSGSSGLTADSCAGCHRAHTAQGLYLLVQEEGPALCLSCHGATGVGATTDVETGLQYAPTGTSGAERGATLGALRAGGFVQARIGSGAAYRVSYTSGTNIRQNAKVPVGAAQNVTSAHLPLVGGKVSITTGTAWGYGADSATPNPGAANIEMDCVSCHNPHGNGQYRILKDWSSSGNTPPAGITALVAPVVVTDAALPPAGDARNYTVIQNNPSTGTLLASQVAALGLPATAGDYWRRKVPWNGTSGTANDAPNGQSATWFTQYSQWCLTCHQRYLSAGWDNKTTDAIYMYRHTSNASSRNCATCHVAHGSNAQMIGYNSQHVALPDNILGGVFNPVSSTASTDSRLLKVDNRGTCQLCHEPTGTVKAPDVAYGPVPVPLLP